MSLDADILAIQEFQGNSLRRSIASIEATLKGQEKDGLHSLCQDLKVDAGFMASAQAIKKVAGEINVIIHAAGILHALEYLLQPDEIIESLSLGAGNTGRKFDLETNLRVAEFKFIEWRGGSEAIRQNGLFKDFVLLAEHETAKKKFLYVIGTKHPLRFLNGKRQLHSVLGGHPLLLVQLRQKYGEGLRYASDYYALKKDEVHLVDVAPLIGVSEADP